jgi:putative cardiolipin synthase
LKLKELMRSVGSYRLRLAQDGEHVQWIGVEDGKEVIYDDEPGERFGTRLEIRLLSPFISESLL